MAMERLDKLLAHLGLGSRKEVRSLIGQGRVKVDGLVITDPGAQVNPAGQQLALDGTSLPYRSHFYVTMPKPPV